MWYKRGTKIMKITIKSMKNNKKMKVKINVKC